MTDDLRDARSRVRVQIRAERDRQFTALHLAYKLGRELHGLGYAVSVDLVGGDNPHDAVRRRRQMRLVAAGCGRSHTR